MKRMKFRFITGSLLGTLLLFGAASPLVFTSCENEHPEISITLTSDYNGIIDAINNVGKDLAEKLALIEGAVKDGTLKNQEALDLISKAIESLKGGLEEKLAAIEVAIKDQTTGLETKLALIEAAVSNGFADSAAAQDLIRKAIESLTGSLEEKLAAIEVAITDQTTGLETKLSLIKEAMKAQTLSLEGKLDLLTAAVKNLPDYTLQLEAIEAAIAGLPDYSDKLEAIEAAISALPDYSSKFDAVVTALTGIKTELEALGAEQTAIATQIGNAVTAINSLVSEVSSGNTDAATALALIIQKLEEIRSAIENIETGGGSGSGSGDSPEGALSGKFSVGAGRQVQFSKGNLQATYDGGKYSWGFAANQYDYVGNAPGNTTIGSQTNGSVVDAFGWSTDAANNNFGINTSSNKAYYSGNFVDWGKNIGDGSTWRTLSKDEWVYLFKTRTNASSLYKCGVTVCDKTNCVIIAPDGFTGSIASSYDASTWSAAEAAGLVCLPAAGDRNGSTVLSVGNSGYYWSSSALDSDDAHSMIIHISHVSPDNLGSRVFGRSVRLITDVAGSAPEEPVHEDPLSGKFSVSSTKQVQFSKGNLQATYDGSKYSWGFAAHQYDYVGDAAGNTTIDSQTSGAVVDLFGWSTDATNFGINTSKDDSDYSGDFVDWGKNIGDGSTWRTLSHDEWEYLFKTRTNASSLHRCEVTVCDKTDCLIIAPDSFAETIAASYDTSTWPAAEAAGLVCLPAAGDRSGSDLYNVGDGGFYWLSAAPGCNDAYSVSFYSGMVGLGTNYYYFGFSVRLITDVN